MLGESERLEIESACRSLMHRYCGAMDLHDVDGMLQAFAEDAKWVRPRMRPMRGHDDMRAFFESFRGARFTKNPRYLDLHLITTCFIEAESAVRARGATWAMMYSDPEYDGQGPAVMPDRPEMIVLYRDVFEKRPDGWKIARHEATHQFLSPAYRPPVVPPSMRPHE